MVDSIEKTKPGFWIIFRVLTVSRGVDDPVE
jgi:hypothetical protein